MPFEQPRLERPRIRSYHLVLGTLFTVLLIVGALTWVAVGAVRSLTWTNSHNEAWARVNQDLIEISAQINGVVNESEDELERNQPTEFDAEAKREVVVNIGQRLRADLGDLVVDEDVNIDLAVSRLESAAFDVLDGVEDVNTAVEAGDPTDVSWKAQILSNRDEVFDFHVLNVVEIGFAAENNNLTVAADLAQRRLQQVQLAMIPAGMLVLVMALVANHIRRREDDLHNNLTHQREEAQAIVDCLPVEIAWKDTDHRLIGVNSQQRSQIESWDVEKIVGRRVAELAPEQGKATWHALEQLEQRAMEHAAVQREEYQLWADDEARTVRYSSAPLVRGDEQIGVVTYGEDVTEAREMERALATSGRMESIGQLAAGVAHEINTPVQFVSDNTDFLTATFQDLIDVAKALADLANHQDRDEVTRLLQEADLDFLVEEVPLALAQSREGLLRVAEIVRALKDFSYPGDEIGDTDVNRIIESTAAVCRNEWKYVAELDLDLDAELPPVQCSEGRLKQVILNMIVNAAHAIEDANGSEADKGRITVGTRRVGDQVEITVGDDGAGMNPHVRQRIFDQFFTTKAVGRGTGQGLSLAWDVIQSHNGSIDVDSTEGEGSTFLIRLPLEQAGQSARPPSPDGDGPPTRSPSNRPRSHSARS